MTLLGTAYTLLLLSALLSALFAGRSSEAGAALFTGAEEAVQLSLRLAGPLIFYSALMALLEDTGITGGLNRLLRPLLCRLFPTAREDESLLTALSCNVSANLLGLGNAATPAGIRAAERLRRRGRAWELRRLVVLNTASVQLLPATVAALRAGAGAEEPFAILPAVWITSLFSVCAGLSAERLLRRDE